MSEPYASAPCLAIFDHDGVLVDSLENHQTSWIELGRRTGLPITSEFVHATFGMTNPSIFERLLGPDYDRDEMNRLADIKELCYRDAARPNLTLMDGVIELLDGLTELGVRLAIGSSAVLANLELTIEVCRLEGRFAGIASLEDVQRGKPDPQVFLTAARKSGVEPKRSVVFEDAPVGIMAAKAAGMHAVGVTTSHPAKTLWDSGADEVVETLVGYDVPALVARLRQ
jgi:HAD superfamily hydrolase (TIGR01509 family)